jgi:hypothetical protein
MTYAYLTHAGRVISAGTGRSPAAAATAALAALPDAFGELAAADCHFRFFRSTV